MKTHLEIAVAVGKFVDELDAAHARHMAKNHPTLRLHKHELEFLTRYARVSRDGSVECFVDLATGEVFRPASWKAPNRKRPQGNVFDGTVDLPSMGYGYL